MMVPRTREITLDQALEQQSMKRRRTQTVRYSEQLASIASIGQPAINLEEPDSSSCSPDKNEMSLENEDFSYDGDSDMEGMRRSKLKKRRSKKHQRKDKLRKSPSPRKGKRAGTEDVNGASNELSPNTKVVA